MSAPFFAPLFFVPLVEEGQVFDRIRELDEYDTALGVNPNFMIAELRPTPLEADAGVESLALLQYKRRQIARQLAAETQDGKRQQLVNARQEINERVRSRELALFAHAIRQQRAGCVT